MTTYYPGDDNRTATIGDTIVNQYGEHLTVISLSERGSWYECLTRTKFPHVQMVRRVDPALAIQGMTA